MAGYSSGPFWRQRRLRLALVPALLAALLTTAGPSSAQDDTLPTACPAGDVPALTFPDVASTSPHAFAIACLAWDRHAVVRGRTDGTYGPGEAVRRDQMAGFVVRALAAAGAALPDDPPPAFTDTAGNVFAREIDQLAAAGVVRGAGDGRYAPSEPVFRDQMATFLVGAYAFATGTRLDQDGAAFTDIAGNTHEANIRRAAGAGFARGTTDTTFDPRRLVRRDQMASFLARLLDRLLADLASAEGYAFVDGEYVDPPYEVEVAGLTIRLNGHVIRSRDGDFDSATSSNGEVTASLQREAEWLSEVLASGGVVVVTDGAWTAVPASDAAQFLHDLVGVFDLPEQDHVAAMRGVVNAALAPLLVAAGSPADAIGNRMPAQPAAAQHTTTGGTRALSHGDHSDNRTPGSREAWLFTPLEAEGVMCYGDVVVTHVIAHGYVVNWHWRGVPGAPTHQATLPALADSGIHSNAQFDPSQPPPAPFVDEHGQQVGRAGVLYVCAEERGAIELHATQASADAAADGYTQLGYSGVEVVPSQRTPGSWYVKASPEFISTHWRSAGTIVFDTGCRGDGDYAAAYQAREYIAAERCGGNFLPGPPGSNLGQWQDYMHEFWGRLHGIVDDGHSRPVGVAFNASQGAARDYRHSGQGLTVLSPGVASVAPTGPITAPGTVTSRVRFDAAVMVPGAGAQPITVSGSCARPGETAADTFTMVDDYTLEFTTEAQTPGALRFTVQAHQVVSTDNGTFIDGNQDPSGTDHVGRNGDNYIWDVPCQWDVGGVMPDDHELTIVVRSSDPEIGVLETEVQVEPDKPSYSTGEEVVITVPENFESGGYAHDFSFWTLEPQVPHEPGPAVIWLVMEDDVTATAWYESTPSGDY